LVSCWCLLHMLKFVANLRHSQHFLHDFHVSFFTFINVVVCVFKNHVICVFVFSQIKIVITVVPFQVQHKSNYFLICQFFEY
jgi:hypothetical protein